MKKKSFLRLSSGLLTILALCSCGSSRWTKLAPMPEPSGGFVAAGVGDHLIIAGGTNWRNDEKHWLTTTHALSLETKKWDDAPTLASWNLPQPLGYAVSGEYNGKMVFAGGSTGKSPATTLGVVTFGQVSTVPMAVRKVLAAGGVVRDDLILVGGSDDAANLAGLTRSTVAVSLKAGGGVRTLPDYPGEAFGTAASAVVGETLLVFCGANWDAAKAVVKNSDSAYAFDHGSQSWQRCKDLPHAVRGISAVALDDDTVYLGGGYPNDETGFTAQGWLYHLKADTYTPAPPLPYPAMVSLVAHQGYVYCLGGEDKKKSRTNKCYRIRVAALLSASE